PADSRIAVVATSPAPRPSDALSLHDALPICSRIRMSPSGTMTCTGAPQIWPGLQPTPTRFMAHYPTVPRRLSMKVYPTRRTPLRSEEHTSELQSRFDLVCRLLLETRSNSASR